MFTGGATAEAAVAVGTAGARVGVAVEGAAARVGAMAGEGVAPVTTGLRCGAVG